MGSATTNRAYIGNLPSKATSADLRQLFEPFGKLVVVDMKSGFGFVEFETDEEVQMAIEGANGTEFLGNQILVERARPKSVPGDGHCYNCGKEGHWARTCPEP